MKIRNIINNSIDHIIDYTTAKLFGITSPSSKVLIDALKAIAYLPDAFRMPAARITKENTQHMIEELDWMHEFVINRSAFADYKSDHGSLQWTDAVETAKKRVLVGVSIQEYREILEQLIAMLNDSHTRILFKPRIKDFWNFTSYLPLSTYICENRLYIDKIDENLSHLKKDDEIIKIDGQQAFQYLQNFSQKFANFDNSDHSRSTAIPLLFKRNVIFNSYLPMGKLNLTIYSQSLNKEIELPVIWKTGSIFRIFGMIKDVFSHHSSVDVLLGPILDESKTLHHTMQLQQLDHQKVIGVLQVKDFNEISSKDLEKLYLFIKNAEKTTQGMVIDLRGNPGESTEPSSQLFGCFIKESCQDYPIKHSTMTDDTVNEIKYLYDAYNGTKMQCETRINKISNEIKLIDEAHINSQDVKISTNLHYLKLIKVAEENCLAEYNKKTSFYEEQLFYCEQGAKFVKFLPNKFFPNESTSYTKPIVILIDELTASAAVHFAAIMQDQRRAVLFGAIPAEGAGADPTGGGQSRGPFEIMRLIVASGHSTRTSQDGPEREFIVRPDVECSIQHDDRTGRSRHYLDTLKKTLEFEIQKYEPNVEEQH